MKKKSVKNKPKDRAQASLGRAVDQIVEALKPLTNLDKEIAIKTACDFLRIEKVGRPVSCYRWASTGAPLWTAPSSTGTR